MVICDIENILNDVNKIIYEDGKGQGEALFSC